MYIRNLTTQKRLCETLRIFALVAFYFNNVGFLTQRARRCATITQRKSEIILEKLLRDKYLKGTEQ